MSEVVMYCTRFCPYCTRAERLLTQKGIEVEKIRVDHDPALWSEMEDRSGRSTVPQIFVGDRHIGGYDDLAMLERDGELDSLLEPDL
jgi:glutaredoxin 3